MKPNRDATCKTTYHNLDLPAVRSLREVAKILHMTPQGVQVCERRALKKITQKMLKGGVR